MSRLPFVVFTLSVVVFAIAATASETDALVLRLLETSGVKVDLTGITAENRPEVVGLLRGIATHNITKIGTVLPDDMAAQIVLLRLADSETIQRVVRDYRASYEVGGSFRSAEDLELAANGAVVPYLAEDFSLEDGETATILREGREAVRIIPRSAFSSVTTLRILIASDQFSSDVRQWAKRRLIKGAFPFGRLREDLRLWWQQNRAAFDQGDYKAVRPLQLDGTVAAVKLKPSSPVTSAAVGAYTAPVVASEAADSSAAPVAVAPAAAPTPTSRQWPWVAGAVVVVTVLAFAWRARTE